MKLCQSCGQLLAEDISTCPACGNEVAEGRKTIDDYRIIEVLHEGYATILCRAVKDQAEDSVMIRIFSPQSGVDETIAERLKNELAELKKLPEDYFVRHFEIRRSSDGLWYRVSEWLDAENWGNLIASGAFQDYRVAFQLFYRIASILEGLHRIGHFIPHLILDDILVLKDDFAVLKIDRVPAGLQPLPLDEKMEALTVPKLSPVIALGFPLGSRTQEATVNVSVTQGHVRRAFENLLQVDTSIHRGNSGGPVIDIHGRVIGIASGVAMDWIAGPVPLPTLLSDMGMVLPINKAVGFLQELKAGKVKWNGVLDLSVDAKIKKTLDLAEKRRWSEAQSLADQELKTSFDPTLVLAAAMIHFCADDYEKAGFLFAKALSMDDKNDQARLMLLLIDWLANRSAASPYGRDLLALDWRSPHEFFGYLVRVLEGKIAEDTFLRGGYTDQERHWLRYVAALVADRNHDTAKAEKLLQPVVLKTGRENWLHFLALARLEKTEQQKLASIDDPEARRQYQAQLNRFAQKFQKSRPELAERRALLAPLQAQLGQDSLAPEAKRALLEQVLKIDPADGDRLAQMVFYCTMEENWDLALEYAHRFLSLDGRENAGRLQVGLLAAEILLNMGREEEALAELENFVHNTEDAWYRSIAQCLLGREKEKSLAEKARESPEYVLTGHMALGLWAEGNGDKKKAIDHYREALGSYMDDMIEYVFAVERIKRLRQKSD